MDFSQVPPDLLNKISDRLARTTWVVLVEINGKLTLINDVGLGTPWRGQGEYGRRRAVAIADEAFREKGLKAEPRLWGEAWGLLIKQYGGREKLEEALFQRMIDKQKNIQEQPKLKKRL